MENKTPIIRMDGLGKAFTGSQGTVRALEDISLEIMPGEIFGIIGLSGAGKSTLVRCMNYLEVPTEGAHRGRGRYGRPVPYVLFVPLPLGALPA